ncbi:MAG: NAD(+)/NADH kinase [Lachnospiraceae bacterium]|nr:NAD(+)/NADH kinase [Lachnospiraceae bacterium]
MEKILIVTNSYKDKDLAVTKEIMGYIEEAGKRTGYILTDLGDEIVIPEEHKDCEAILVLGGDGTFIHATKKAAEMGIPVVGVNLGSLGYLCELEADHLKEDIASILDDNYIMEERMMLTGLIRRDGLPFINDVAINDVVIHRGGDLRVLNFIIYINGQHLYTYTADGVIVATPTGSTGYSMSAGGPIVEPQAKLTVITPINPHILNGKSIILSSKDEIVIEIGDGRRTQREEALVTFDGGESIKVYSGDRIEIKRTDKGAKIIRLNNKSFLKTLSKKMQEYR